ncbi:MAG: transcriptional repressor [Erysipelothrix sp.]|nr:transcriptional repressor [Erysipelothrix sp.]
MKNIKIHETFFKEYSIKNTRQRSIVLDILDNSKEAKTAEEIFLLAKDIDETISLSTIYRTLTLFVEKKFLIKMSALEENLSKYALNKADHAHYLLCLKCDKRIEVGYCPLSVYEESLKETYNFNIVGHKLEIFGYCQDCQNS